MWTKDKFEHKLLNMKREDTLHVRLVNLFLLVVCHSIYVTKNIPLWITGCLYTAMKTARVPGKPSVLWANIQTVLRHLRCNLNS